MSDSVIILILFINKSYWHAKDYFYKSDSFFSTIYDGTTDTGESSPVWSIRFMEQRPKSRVEVIGGEAKVNEVKRNSTVHQYLIDVKTETAQIKDNTVYFPGWKVIVNGKQVPVEFQDRNNLGLITFHVPLGANDVVVKFTNTKLRVLSNMVSFLTLLTLFICGAIVYFKMRKSRS